VRYDDMDLKSTKSFLVARWEFFILAIESILATVVVFAMMSRWMPSAMLKSAGFAAAGYIMVLAALLPAQSVLQRRYTDGSSPAPRWLITAGWLVAAGLVGGIVTTLLPR
jgi:hypothetical protein